MNWSSRAKTLFLLWLLIFFSLEVGFAATEKGDSVSTDSLKVYYLGEVVVTAQRAPTALTSVIREVGYEQIRENNIFNVAGAVEMTPGSYVSIGSRNEMIVQLRGIEQRQISIMLDGVPIYVPYDGLVDLGQIPTSVVRKISVTEGNASVLYGPNSLGGSINILTSIPTKTSSRLGLFWGSGERQSYLFQQSLALKKFGFLLSIAHRRQDFFPLSANFDSTKNEDGDRRENSFYKNTDFYGKISFRPNQNHHTALSFSLIDNEKGVIPDIYANPPRYWKFPLWRKWVLNLSSSQQLGNSFLLKTIFFYDKYDNILDAYDDATYTTQFKRYAFHSTYDDYSIGSNIFLTYKFSPLNELTLGINYKRDVHKEQDDREELWETYRMETYTLGAEHELKTAEGIALSGGLSINLEHAVYANGQPLRDDIVILDGRVGTFYTISPELEIFSSMGHKTRFPTLKELYSGYSGRNIPNPDLKEESAYNFEIGANYLFSSEDKLSLVLFDSHIANLIFEKTVMIGGDKKRQQDNIGKARIFGVELSAILKLEKNTTIQGSYAFLKARNLSSSRISDKLEYRPEHRVMVNGRRKFGFGMDAGLTLNYIAKRIYLDDDGYGHSMPDYMIIDTQLRQSLWKNLILTFEAKNILDENYQTEYGFPMSGRTFGAGMEIEL